MGLHMTGKCFAEPKPIWMQAMQNIELPVVVLQGSKPAVLVREVRNL
jgi:hypothetical protein